MKITTSIYQSAIGCWHAQVFDYGKPVDSFYGKSEAQARKWLKRTVVELQNGPLLDLAGDQPHTLALDF